MTFRERLLCFVLVCLGWTFHITPGELTVKKKCGDLTCVVYQYCSLVDNRCKQCKDVCDRDLHSFQPDRCEEDCQDYLHEIKFVKKNGMELKDLEAIQNKIHRLTIVVGVLGFLTILMFLLAVTKGAQKYVSKWKKKLQEMKSAKKSKEAAMSLSVIRLETEQQRSSLPSARGSNNPHLQVPSAFKDKQEIPKREDGKRVPRPSSGQGHRPPKRQPSESTVPEHAIPAQYAYDNPAMTPSPTQTQGSESAFRSM